LDIRIPADTAIFPYRYVSRRHSKNKYCFGMPVSAEPMAAKIPDIPSRAAAGSCIAFEKTHALAAGE